MISEPSGSGGGGRQSLLLHVGTGLGKDACDGIRHDGRIFGKKNFTNGFTLAEVLITLGIIGIVAAMTLPALITRNQNKALEASLKKNHSVIQQAFEMYQAEHGEKLNSNMLTSHGELKSSIIKYFAVITDCGFGSSDKDTACLPMYENNSPNYKAVYKTYNNNIMALNYIDDGQFIISDGSIIFIEDYPGSNVKFITADVNGYRKNPNKLGHDLFTFQLMDDGRILPMGAPDTLYTDKNVYCSPNSNHQWNGIACTYYALTEKDYFNNLPR